MDRPSGSSSFRQPEVVLISSSSESDDDVCILEDMGNRSRENRFTHRRPRTPFTPRSDSNDAVALVKLVIDGNEVVLDDESRRADAEKVEVSKETVAAGIVDCKQGQPEEVEDELLDINLENLFLEENHPVKNEVCDCGGGQQMLKRSLADSALKKCFLCEKEFLPEELTEHQRVAHRMEECQTCGHIKIVKPVESQSDAAKGASKRKSRKPVKVELKLEN